MTVLMTKNEYIYNTVLSEQGCYLSVKDTKKVESSYHLVRKKKAIIRNCTVNFLERLLVPPCIQILFLLGQVHRRHFYDTEGPMYAWIIDVIK